MLRGQLRWAIDHDFPERVELLARHDVDLRSPFPADGRTPVEVALRSGRRALVEMLVAYGAPRPDPKPVDAFVGAALAADRAELDRLAAADPGLEARACRERPGLVVWAAADGRAEAIRLLVERGFDVNALGRGDTPVEGRWETALHQAAQHGNVELALLLLELGADPDRRDARFDSTPLGWSRHFDQPAVAAILTPLTTPEPPAG
ncbi:MAG: ankyrin repeat domain-containing protein [Frankia sp.]